jgi:hypothetical protein
MSWSGLPCRVSKPCQVWTNLTQRQVLAGPSLFSCGVAYGLRLPRSGSGRVDNFSSWLQDPTSPVIARDSTSRLVPYITSLVHTSTLRLAIACHLCWQVNLPGVPTHYANAAQKSHTWSENLTKVLSRWSNPLRHAI